MVFRSFLITFAGNMHKNKYKYVSIVSAVAVLLLLDIYMWMTYRSVSRDIAERAGNQLMWAMFYESYTRANLVTEEDTLSLPEARGNLSLASSVEGMNDALSQRFQSEISLDTVAMYVDSLLSVVGINRDVTIQEVRGKMEDGRWKMEKVVRQNNERSSSWSLMTKPVSICRDGSRAIRMALNNPYPELARRLSPLFLVSAIILGFFAIIIIQLLRFITEQEQMTELRNDFSYAMVHDMKSPLSSIIMGTHFLHSGKVDDKPQIKEKYYSIIEEEAEHLLALVNKLLTISKLENKKLILNKNETNLQPIIDDLVEKAKAKATKPIKVTTSLEVKQVLADEQYLTEAIANLIDNAVKYSKDEIEVSIKTFDTDRNVLLKVRDNGIGMTKEEQQVIFDKFGRAAIHEKNRKGGVSGFGLGLNYVDQVMRAHGGKVTVASEKDRFAEFTLYIPKPKNETKKTEL